jgi:tight adherence protein C
MTILIYLFLILGAALILISILQSSGGRVIGARLPQETREAKKIRVRSFLASIFPFTQKILAKLRLDAKIKNKLDAGHIKVTAQEYFNIKLLVMLGLSVSTIFIMEKFNPIVFSVGLFLGYIIPDFWLKRKIAKRKYAIVRILPETVDLLGLCVEAGLDFTSAVNWVLNKVPHNPMMEELGFVLEEIKWGKPRTQALRDMSKRLNIPEVSSFVQTLVQAERMGTPVAEAFTILSEDGRLQRFHRGERVALQAPIKILIPLIFCILPVIGIVIGGPILLQFSQGKLF